MLGRVVLYAFLGFCLGLIFSISHVGGIVGAFLGVGLALLMNYLYRLGVNMGPTYSYEQYHGNSYKGYFSAFACGGFCGWFLMDIFQLRLGTVGETMIILLFCIAFVLAYRILVPEKYR